MMNVIQKFLVVFLAVGVLTACNKEEAVVEQSISEEEAVEMVELALSSESAGLTEDVEMAASISDEQLEKASPNCGIQFDTSFTVTNNPQALRTYEYTTSLGYELICEGIFPSALDLNATSTGTYSSNRRDLSYEVNYNSTIDNLRANEPNFSYSGTTTRDGEQLLHATNFKEERTTNSVMTLETTELLVDKETYEIVSGVTTFSLTGTVRNGNAYSYQGSITYLGNGAATIEINGNTYDIQI